jgi:hypothetical protein
LACVGPIVVQFDFKRRSDGPAQGSSLQSCETEPLPSVHETIRGLKVLKKLAIFSPANETY